MSKVGIYARQSVAEDQGIAQQLAEVRADMERRGLLIVDEYADNATSATKTRDDATAWARMLRDADAGRIDTVAVTETSRLMRRLADIIEIRRRDLRVIVVRGGIDTAEPTGRFMLAQLVLLAEQEIDSKEARAKPYRAARRAAGHPTPGMTPYGYAWIPKVHRDATERRWAIEPTEGAIVRRMFTWAGERVALGDIARRLNEPAEGAPVLTRQGARWGTSTVKRILLNPFYAGLLPEKFERDDGARRYYRAELIDLAKCTPGNWDALVTEEQLRRARHLLIRPERRTNGGVVSRKWLLSGWARCDVCGGPVHSRTAKGGGYRVYRCEVGHFQRAADAIDWQVGEHTIARLTNPRILARLRPPSDEIDLEALRLSIDAREQQRANVLQLVASGHYGLPEATVHLIPLAAEIEGLQAELDSASAANPALAVASAEDVRAAWDALDVAGKRAVLRALPLPVFLRPVGKGIRTPIGSAALAASVWVDEDVTDEYVGEYPTPVVERGLNVALGPGFRAVGGAA